MTLILSRKQRYLFLIPLILSAFTHIWNPSGFPDIFYDEGVYMRRAINVIEGLGPQEGTYYDHPFFGQLFLAATLTISGFPISLHANQNPEAIPALLSVPRLIMGLLAIFDTFLIYKIGHVRYGTNVALLASILFAVMPFTWLTRRILLDSILLPFALSSILLACYVNRMGERRVSFALTILSGVLLGIAVFTKIPAIIIAPLVIYLLTKPTHDSDGEVQQRLNFRIQKLGLFLIPLFAIPMIWPIYSISEGEFDAWISTVMRQAQNRNDMIIGMWAPFALIDPVIVGLGIAGFVFAAMRRDFFLLLWLIPSIVLFTFVGFHQYFHLLPVIPAFCIGASVFVLQRLSAWSVQKQMTQVKRIILVFVPVFALMLFGFANTMALVTTDMTSAQIQAAAYAIQQASDNNTFTIVTSPSYSWIIGNVYDTPHTLKDYRDILYATPETNEVLLFIDPHFKHDYPDETKLNGIYANTEHVKTFTGNYTSYDKFTYPYANLFMTEDGSVIEVRKGSSVNLISMVRD